MDVTEELTQALSYCELPTEFASVVEDYPSKVIEKAIALQDTQPRRQQLTAWYEAADALEQKESQLEFAIKLLREAIGHGADTVCCVLSRWASLKRWEAVLRLEENSLEDMRRLMAIAPNWAQWCEAP